LQTPPTNWRSLIKLLLISSLVMEQSIKTTRPIPVFARWAAPSTPRQIFIDVSKSLYDERFRFEYFLSQTEAELEFREGGNWWFNCVPPVGEWQIWNWGNARKSSSPPLPSLLLLPFPYPPLPFPPSLALPSFLPSFLLEVGPLNPARDRGSAVSFPSGVWGGSPAEIEFGASQL